MSQEFCWPINNSLTSRCLHVDCNFVRVKITERVLYTSQCGLHYCYSCIKWSCKFYLKGKGIKSILLKNQVNKWHLCSCPANGGLSVPNNLESKSVGLESRFKRNRRFKNGDVLRPGKKMNTDKGSLSFTAFISGCSHLLYMIPDPLVMGETR